MSNSIDPTSVTNSSITVTPSGGSAIAGTVTLAANGVNLTFVPSAALTASKVYNVSVSGFKDIDGNAVTTFTSSFTTGTTAYGSGSFSLVSTSPASGATGVSVTSPVTFTMTNNYQCGVGERNTVYVYVASTSYVIAGSYSVNGATVTFTPETQYPANTLMGMYVYGADGRGGQSGLRNAGNFTTANTVDHTAADGDHLAGQRRYECGINTQIVLTFSKSINAVTITTNTLALFNGDTAIGYNYTDLSR